MHLFQGNMDAVYFQTILNETLFPFIEERFPDGHRLWMDNDPKHTAHSTRLHLLNHGITWWRTPAESPVCKCILNTTFINNAPLSHRQKD